MLIWKYAGFQWVFYLGTSAAAASVGPAAASARDALKGCLRDNHPAVRQSAGRSLKQINALPVAPDD